MFIREGLLDPLSAALLNVMAIRDAPTQETKMKVIQILLVFSQVSQSDIHVRNALGTRKVVRRTSFRYPLWCSNTNVVLLLGLLRACELLEPECLVQMLKAVKHLSMNATLHEVLQNANALEILIRILEEQSSGPHSTVSHIIFLSIVGCLIVCTTGNFQPRLPNLLQPLSPEQITTRRSRTSWYHTLSQTSHPNILSTPTIRPTHPLRPFFSWKVLPHSPLATPRPTYVSPAAG